MAQLQQLACTLNVAGSAMHPEGKGSYLLYTDERSSLVCKHFTGTDFGESEFITSNIRPNSSAAYLLTVDTQTIFCIAQDSSLRVVTYDEDEEDWVDAEDLPRYEIHPDGHVDGCFGLDGSRYIFFQDNSGILIALDQNWAPTVLPVDAAVGTPITTTITGTSEEDAMLYLFYVGKDNLVHFLRQRGGGGWEQDSFVATTATEGLRRLKVAQNGETKNFEVYALGADKSVIQITQGEEQKKDLGRIDQEGNFVPGTDAECALLVWLCYRLSFSFSFSWGFGRRRKHACLM